MANAKLAQPIPVPLPKVGTKVPDFTLTTLAGKPVSLAVFLGKKHVLLEFGSITEPKRRII